MIRSIDFYDELAKWTAIEVIKGIGQCVETVSGIDDRRKSMVFNECRSGDVVTPRPDEMDTVSGIYQRIVEQERASSEESASLRALAHTLIEREQLDVILLAGTDLLFVFTPESTDFPHIDGTRTHIDAIMHRLAPDSLSSHACLT